MKAITVVPGTGASAAFREVPEPPHTDGDIVVQAVAVGLCGTDAEIAAGNYGWAPPGRDHIIIGHESLGRVSAAPPDLGLAVGDLVVGIVRRPDPEPCPSCAVGEWDMCRNGVYTERGIKERDGYASERYRVEPAFCVKVDPALESVGMLLEPASIVVKAWDQIDRIGRRANWAPRRVLITGAGPIGLLATLLSVERGLDVNVFDTATTGRKPELVKELGASYHTGELSPACAGADVVIECTGAGQVVFDVMGDVAPDGIVCLVGVSSPGRHLSIDAGALNTDMVLGNRVVFGSVNANRAHYETAATALASADLAWLKRLITRRVPLDRWAEAFKRQPNDIKVVIDFHEA
jgi:threonine dehydrogenase-like Zn-dependent dehydrogenase